MANETKQEVTWLRGDMQLEMAVGHTIEGYATLLSSKKEGGNIAVVSRASVARAPFLDVPKDYGWCEGVELQLTELPEDEVPKKNSEATPDLVRLVEVNAHLVQPYENRSKRPVVYPRFEALGTGKADFKIALRCDSAVDVASYLRLLGEIATRNPTFRVEAKGGFSYGGL